MARASAIIATALIVGGSTVACTESSDATDQRSASAPTSIVPDTEPSGFLVTAIDGTNTWPPPLTATPAEAPGKPIRIHVPDPGTSSDWDWSPDGSMLLWLEYV